MQEFKYISNDVTFRGINYKSEMSVCFGVDEYSFYNICLIKNIVFNETFEKLCFIGQTCKIQYNEVSGLYEEYFHSNNLVCVPFFSLINPETLLQLKYNDKNICWFKSAPFETL